MAEIIKDTVTARIISCCFEVHKELGPGFPEKVYHNALKYVMDEKGLLYESEKEFVVYFKDKRVGTFRCDLFIENVIVELKSVTGIMPILFRNQLVSYLKASKVKTGLLINFGNKSCDIKRISV